MPSSRAAILDRLVADNPVSSDGDLELHAARIMRNQFHT